MGVQVSKSLHIAGRSKRYIHSMCLFFLFVVVFYIRLLLQTNAVLSALVGCYFGKASILSIIKAFIPVSTNCYWFISCYILLMIFSPYINRAINSMSELQHRQLLLFMSAVFLVAPTVIYYSVLGEARML